MSNQPFAIETQTIGLTLWNPTNENLDMQYAGISLTLNAGVEQVFEINCAKHLLNSFGPRGLTSLVFGCDEKRKKQIGDDARERNRRFKEDMVRKYNQQNAVRTQLGMGYLPATEAVVKYAHELGIKLDDKFTSKDPERQEVSALKAENADLKGKIGELMGKFELLMEQLDRKQDAPPPPVEDFVCPKCKQTLPTQEAWDKHVKAHGGR